MQDQGRAMVGGQGSCQRPGRDRVGLHPTGEHLQQDSYPESPYRGRSANEEDVVSLVHHVLRSRSPESPSEVVGVPGGTVPVDGDGDLLRQHLLDCVGVQERTIHRVGGETVPSGRGDQKPGGEQRKHSPAHGFHHAGSRLGVGHPENSVQTSLGADPIAVLDGPPVGPGTSGCRVDGKVDT